MASFTITSTASRPSTTAPYDFLPQYEQIPGSEVLAQTTSADGVSAPSVAMAIQIENFLMEMLKATTGAKGHIDLVGEGARRVYSIVLKDGDSEEKARAKSVDFVSCADRSLQEFSEVKETGGMLAQEGVFNSEYLCALSGYVYLGLCLLEMALPALRARLAVADRSLQRCEVALNAFREVALLRLGQPMPPENISFPACARQLLEWRAGEENSMMDTSEDFAPEEILLDRLVGDFRSHMPPLLDMPAVMQSILSGQETDSHKIRCVEEVVYRVLLDARLRSPKSQSQLYLQDNELKALRGAAQDGLGYICRLVDDKTTRENLSQEVLGHVSYVQGLVNTDSRSFSDALKGRRFLPAMNLFRSALHRGFHPASNIISNSARIRDKSDLRDDTCIEGIKHGDPLCKMHIAEVNFAEQPSADFCRCQALEDGYRLLPQVSTRSSSIPRRIAAMLEKSRDFGDDVSRFVRSGSNARTECRGLLRLGAKFGDVEAVRLLEKCGNEEQVLLRAYLGLKYEEPAVEDRSGIVAEGDTNCFLYPDPFTMDTAWP